MDLLSLKRSLWAMRGFRYDGDGPSDSTNGSASDGGGRSGDSPGGYGSYGGTQGSYNQHQGFGVGLTADGLGPGTTLSDVANKLGVTEDAARELFDTPSLFSQVAAAIPGLLGVGLRAAAAIAGPNNIFGKDGVVTAPAAAASASAGGFNPQAPGEGASHSAGVTTTGGAAPASDDATDKTPVKTESQTIDEILADVFTPSGSASTGRPANTWQPNFTYGDTGAGGSATGLAPPSAASTIAGKYNPDIAAYVNSLDWSKEGTAASAIKLRQAMAQYGVSVEDVSASTGHPVAAVNSLLGVQPATGSTGSTGATGGVQGGYTGAAPTGGTAGTSAPRSSYMSPEDVSNQTWDLWANRDRPALEAQAAQVAARGNSGYEYLNGLARGPNADLNRMREDVQRYGSQAFQDQNAARYMSDVQRGSDDQYAQMQRQAYASGVDPSRMFAQTANQRAYNTALGKVQAAIGSRNADAGRYTAGLGAVNTAFMQDREQRGVLQGQANTLGMQGYTAGLDLSKLAGQMGTGANQAYNNTRMTDNDAVKASAAASQAAAANLAAAASMKNADSNWYDSQTKRTDSQNQTGINWYSAQNTAGVNWQNADTLKANGLITGRTGLMNAESNRIQANNGTLQINNQQGQYDDSNDWGSTLLGLGASWLGSKSGSETVSKIFGF